jgi:hypothetical protein
MVEEVVHLSDLVADLKQRVEALERALAMQPAGIAPTATASQIQEVYTFGAKWDVGTYSEEDFRDG